MSSPTHDLFFVDLAERELRERHTLRDRARRLVALEQTRDRSGGLSESQVLELKAIQSRLMVEKSIDPFFRQALAVFHNREPGDLAEDASFQHVHGFLGTQRDKPGNAKGLTDDEIEFAAMLGLLMLDGNTDASHQRFRADAVRARGEVVQNRQLFLRAFRHLAGRFVMTVGSQVDRRVLDDEVLQDTIRPSTIPSLPSQTGSDALPTVKRGMVRTRAEHVQALSATHIAGLVRQLANEGQRADDPWIGNAIDSAFDAQSGIVNGAPASSRELVLPDLEAEVDVEIVGENIRAVRAIYFSHMLEEMRLFQVVDKIVDLFRSGLLPLGRGPAGDFLYKYYKSSGERITESERRDLYSRAFGVPGGDPNAAMPNREFNELWLRFVSSVSAFSRQLTVEKLLRNAVPMAVSQETVRKAGRDLAANLSLHGYGVHWFADDLSRGLDEALKLMGDQQIKQSFGARDAFQVIDQVNVNYLGGAKNTFRYRTQARAGAVIMQWLSFAGARLSGRFGSDVISMDELTSPQLRDSNRNPMTAPNDWDLVQACESWLAVSAVQDQSVEHYAQPIESPVMTSKPIGMPPEARAVLERMGVELPTL